MKQNTGFFLAAGAFLAYGLWLRRERGAMSGMGNLAGGSNPPLPIKPQFMAIDPYNRLQGRPTNVPWFPEPTSAYGGTSYAGSAAQALPASGWSGAFRLDPRQVSMSTAPFVSNKQKADALFLRLKSINDALIQIRAYLTPIELATIERERSSLQAQLRLVTPLALRKYI